MVSMLKFSLFHGFMFRDFMCFILAWFHGFIVQVTSRISSFHISSTFYGSMFNDSMCSIIPYAPWYCDSTDLGSRVTCSRFSFSIVPSFIVPSSMVTCFLFHVSRFMRLLLRTNPCSSILQALFIKFFMFELIPFIVSSQYLSLFSGWTQSISKPSC